MVKLVFLTTVFCGTLHAHPCEETKVFEMVDEIKENAQRNKPLGGAFDELEQKMDKHLVKTIKQLDEVKLRVIEIIKLMEKKQ